MPAVYRYSVEESRGVEREGMRAFCCGINTPVPGLDQTCFQTLPSFLVSCIFFYRISFSQAEPIASPPL